MAQVLIGMKCRHRSTAANGLCAACIEGECKCTCSACHSPPFTYHQCTCPRALDKGVGCELAIPRYDETDSDDEDLGARTCRLCRAPCRCHCRACVAEEDVLPGVGSLHLVVEESPETDVARGDREGMAGRMTRGTNKRPRLEDDEMTERGCEKCTSTPCVCQCQACEESPAINEPEVDY